MPEIILIIPHPRWLQAQPASLSDSIRQTVVHERLKEKLAVFYKLPVMTRERIAGYLLDLHLVVFLRNTNNCQRCFQILTAIMEGDLTRTNVPGQKGYSPHALVRKPEGIGIVVRRHLTLIFLRSDIAAATV